MFDLGRLALAQRNQQEAQTRFEQSAALFQKVDNPLWLSKCHLRLARLTDDEDSKRQHLEIAHRCQERLATTDLMLLLEQEAANNHD